MLRDGGHEERISALVSLEELADPDSVPALERALAREGNPSVRGLLAAMLGRPSEL